MATPTLWLSPFQVNSGTAATGIQGSPQIAGLANGGYVVAWQEDATGAVGVSPGSDIIAKIFDASGAILREAFQLNSVFVDDDEGDFTLVATPDGFAITGIAEDSVTPDTLSVFYERFTLAGDSLPAEAETLAVRTLATQTLANPQIAANLLAADDDIFVAYGSTDAADTNVLARVIDDTGLAGTEFAAAQNTAGTEAIAGAAILANGTVVTVYEEPSVSGTGIGLTIRAADGTVAADGGLANGAFAVAATGTDPTVASLSGGGFAVSYAVGDDLFFRIFDSLGGTVLGETQVLPAAAIQQNAALIGLGDGGFVLAWEDATANALMAQRYDGAGLADGAAFTVASGAVLDIDLGLSGDGRILFAWRDGVTDEIFSAIWDPRPAVIDPADVTVPAPNALGTAVITTGLAGSEILAGPDGLTVLGQTGEDTIRATESGAFTGGAGDDLVIAGAPSPLAAARLLDGGEGTDTVDFSAIADAFDIDLAAGTTSAPTEAVTDFENAVTGDGANLVRGTEGANGLVTNGGADTIEAGEGSDTIDAGDGDDSILAGAGDDLIEQSAGADTIMGGDGRDTIFSNGEDVVFGDAGDDVVIVGPGMSSTLDGGLGTDLLEISQFTVDYRISLLTGRTNMGSESFLNFEVILGGMGNDTLTGTNSADGIEGNAGNDLVVTFDGNDTLDGGNESDTLRGGGDDDLLLGGTGMDTLFGQTGNDRLEGGADNDLVDGGAGDDTVFGDFGDDVVRGGEGQDSLIGGLGNDTLAAGNGNDTLEAGEGDDLLFGSGGDDTMDAGMGNDELDGQNGADLMFGDLGNDTLRGGGGNDSMSGGADDDTLFGNASEDTLSGDGGNDVLDGGSQSDVLFGGDGLDTLRGGDGFDSLDGGAEADVLVGGNGNDTLTGGLGQDILRGQAGNDIYAFATAAGSVSGLEDLIDGMDGVGIAGGDRIDLSLIDAVAGTLDDDAFVFLGEQSTADGLAAGAGALWTEEIAEETLLFGLVDGDAVIDLAIRIGDGTDVTAADYLAEDFIL